MGNGISHITLMCRDHEALRFSWDHASSRAVGRLVVVDARYAPYGTLDPTGDPTKPRLARWLAARSVPALRPHAIERVRSLGYGSPLELLSSGWGASLSDQYWLRPDGDGSAWADVSCFTNDFPEELGRFLLPHAPGSEPGLAPALVDDPSLAASSPDASLGGNLSKRWAIRDGQRVMLKGGRAPYFQQPFNEVIAAMLCARLGIRCAPCSLEVGEGLTQWWSVCPCIVDDRTELVPAEQLRTSHRRANDISLHAFYLGLAAFHDLDIAREVEQMLVVDYLLANSDRHWNNFGILMDSETREWKRCAPLFDSGESLWCDRTPAQGFGGYHLDIPGARRPFLLEQDDQPRRYCRDLSWYDPSALEGFADDAIGVLARDPLLLVEPGRLDSIRAALEGRIAAMGELAAERARRRHGA